MEIILQRGLEWNKYVQARNVSNSVTLATRRVTSLVSLIICRCVRKSEFKEEEPWCTLISRSKISGRCVCQMLWNRGSFQAYLRETVKFYQDKTSVYGAEMMWPEFEGKSIHWGEWELVLRSGASCLGETVMKQCPWGCFWGDVEKIWGFLIQFLLLTGSWCL